MNEDFVIISIQCQHCLTWSLDDANFCHRCGVNLRPWPEDLLFAETKELIAKSKGIMDRVFKNVRERLQLETLVPICHMEVECVHCFRWRDRRRMKQTKSGKFLCFDDIECWNAHKERLMRQMLVEKGYSVTDAEKWTETPLQVFGGLTPRQMILDDREEEVRTLLEAELGYIAEMARAMDRLPNNDELKNVEEQITALERKHGLSSDDLRRELSQGRRQETMEDCEWLMLIDLRDHFVKLSLRPRSA